MQVRTPEFKAFFGDWVAARGVQKLDTMEPENLDSLQPAEDQKAVEALFKGFGPVENTADGRAIVFPIDMAGKIIKHKGFDVKQIAGAFSKLFASAVPMGSELEQEKPGHKPHPNIAAYHNYVNKFERGGRTYYIRFTTQQMKAKQGEGQSFAHSSFVSDVAIYETGALSSLGSGLFARSSQENSAPVDIKLAQWLKKGKEPVSKVIDPDTGEPRVVSGMFVKAQSNSFDKIPQSAMVAYNEGRRFGEKFKHDQNAFYDALQFDLEVHNSLLDHGMDGYFFNRGFQGESYPSRFVFAERIGNLPQKGVSYNYRDERHEKGVSVLGILDPDRGLVRQSDGMFEAFNTSNNRKYIGGWLIDETGSDGEPLLLGAVQFRNKVQIKSATGNTGEFSETNDNILHQNKDASRGSFNPESLTVTLLKGADWSTTLHEGAHFFFENDIHLAGELVAEARTRALSVGEQQILKDVSALLAKHGIQGDVEAQLAQWGVMDFEERRYYHETTAEWFEKYIFEGKAPSFELASYFQKFAAWMKHVYKSVKEFLVKYPSAGKLDDEVRGIFDRMLATTEQIQLAEQGRSMMPLFANIEQSGMSVEGYAAYQGRHVDATNTAIEDLQAKGLRDMKWLGSAKGRELKRLQREVEALRAEAMIEARREVMRRPVYRAWQFLTGNPDVRPGDQLANPEALGAGRLDLSALEEMYGEAPALAENKELQRKREVSRFLQGSPIKSIPIDAAPLGQGFKAMREWALEIFNGWGNKAVSPEIGEVVLNEKSVRDSQAHYKRMPLAVANAFAAVKDVIEKGRVVLTKPHKGTESVYISAPVRIGGMDDIVTVLVHRDVNTQRMYLHSAWTKESLLSGGLDKSTASETGSALSRPAKEGGIATVLRDLMNFKYSESIAHPIIEHMKNLRMTTRTAGLHPDIVADLILGENDEPLFSSGDQMVRELAVAPTPEEAIEALTEQILLERHGELATPEAIEQASDAAIHNEARAKFVTTEANALAKAVGKAGILLSAAKEYASQAIGRKRIRDLSPGQYA